MQASQQWLKIHGAPATPPEFRTHANYVAFMKRLNVGLDIKYTGLVDKQIIESKTLRKKVQLVKLTLESIEGERQNIEKQVEFAQLCIAWIPVKSYYLIFNLLLILDYLITTSESSFSSTHRRTIRQYKTYIDKQVLVFNKRVYNYNYTGSRVQNWPVRSGANLAKHGYNPKERIRQIFKLLLRYQIQDLQQKEKIKDFRSKKNRQRRSQFLTTETVNLFEFFYWYRIKANYRDLEFLDHDISDREFYNFYSDYYELTIAFYSTLKRLINVLARKRLNKVLL